MNQNAADHVCPAHRVTPDRSARERVGARTRDLAVLAGRLPLSILQTDYEQAKREITGESTPERQEAFLDASAWS